MEDEVYKIILRIMDLGDEKHNNQALSSLTDTEISTWNPIITIRQFGEQDICVMIIVIPGKWSLYWNRLWEMFILAPSYQYKNPHDKNKMVFKTSFF